MNAAVLRNVVDRGRAAPAVAPVVRGVTALPDVDAVMKPAFALGKGLANFGEGLRAYARAEAEVARETEQVEAANAVHRFNAAMSPAGSAARYAHYDQIRALPRW